MTSSIEYFYSTHSLFAYLGSPRLMAIARAAARPIIHKPVDLNRVVEAAGSTPFATRSSGHRAYFFGREKRRWAEERQVPVMDRTPTHHRNDPGPANRMVIAAVLAGLDADALAHALLRAHWCDDADLADTPTLASTARASGFEPDPLLAGAASPEVGAAYEANTREAIERSVFGSPTYFVDGDMFYGQDRLEMVERALRRPYA